MSYYWTLEMQSQVSDRISPWVGETRETRRRDSATPSGRLMEAPALDVEVGRPLILSIMDEWATTPRFAESVSAVFEKKTPATPEHKTPVLRFSGEDKKQILKLIQRR